MQLCTNSLDLYCRYKHHSTKIYSLDWCFTDGGEDHCLSRHCSTWLRLARRTTKALAYDLLHCLKKAKKVLVYDHLHP